MIKGIDSQIITGRTTDFMKDNSARLKGDEFNQLLHSKQNSNDVRKELKTVTDVKKGEIRKTDDKDDGKKKNKKQDSGKNKDDKKGKPENWQIFPILIFREVLSARWVCCRSAI